MIFAFAMKPFEDEMLSSVWARIARRTRIPISTLATIVLGRKWRPGFFQAGHIQQTAAMLRMEPIDLLFRHTAFGYATAFLQPETYVSALNSALSTGLEARKIGAITQNVSDHTSFRRYCQRCATEQVSKSGISYWRRAHNLPGVLVCLKHRAALFEVDGLATKGHATWTTVEPHEADGRQIDVGAPRRHRFLNKLAELSAAALVHPAAFRVEIGASVYRQTLIESGFLSLGRSLDSAALIRLVRTQMAGPIPAPMKTARGSDDLNWLPLMLRPGVKTPFTPLKHHILRAALDLSGVNAGSRLDFSPRGYQGKERSAIDAECSFALQSLIDCALMRRERLSVVQALKDIGCWELYRHGADSLPLVSAQVQRLRTSPSSVRRTSLRKLARRSRLTHPASKS